MSKIDKMANLVLANPNITAKELAEKLGFAEAKSIYYWLDKAGYKGIKDFRKTVLSRSFPIPIRMPSEAKDSQKLPSLPVYTDSSNLNAFDFHRYLYDRLGPRSFAVQVSKEEFGDTAKPGDLLIIDPDGSFSQGDLLLINTKGKPVIARIYYLSEKSPIFVDALKSNCLLAPDFINGKIVFVVKHSV